MKPKKLCRRAFLLILAGALALGCGLSPLAARAEIADGSEIARSEMKDDGVLRVWLRSLGAAEKLTLKLDGNYALDGDANIRFERGAQIALHNIGGSIWLEAGGLLMNVGSEFALTRHAAEAGLENGLRIAEAERENLYPGDLRVSADGSALRAVLSIGVEDYLRGVIAYEMSDEWPLEALKAQAVAARTYALRAKANSKERDYDLVDTPADQVFSGCDARLENVAEAVRETEGVVGIYGGDFAACYYTASNGGETALPSDVWDGEADSGHLARRADPYDLENERSRASSVEFKRDASDLPALREMLEAALAEQPGGERAELISIEAVSPSEPVAPGSIACRKLKFTLSASVPVPVLEAGEGDIGAPAEPATSQSGNFALFGLDYLRRLLLGSPFEPTGEEEAEPREFEVELDVYDQIKDGLGLGLNAGDCEIVGAAETEGGFEIELRRYGHGVGMSQRGAQTMAASHGMGYEEILAFYYPGMALERVDWDSPELAPLEPEIEIEREFVRSDEADGEQPGDVPLPEPEADEYFARVALNDPGSGVNLRLTPSTDAPVAELLRQNQRVLVRGEPDEEGWVRVRTARNTGFAKIEYLKKE